MRRVKSKSNFLRMPKVKKSTQGMLLLVLVLTGLAIIVPALNNETSFLSFAQKRITLRPFYPPQNIKDTTIGKALMQECKPAIYLYPQTETAVNVQVSPKGHFTATIPTYPAGGWQVTAKPNGQITDANGSYDYLYYESGLIRSEVTQPNEGYVVAYNELGTLFSNVLPQFNLNTKEQQDFTEYWLKALPQASYYFVGVMPRSEIDRLETMAVTPNPDSVLRVRFYFKPLEAPVAVSTPTITSTTRTGFTVAEWGGIVDVGDHEFICSQ